MNWRSEAVDRLQRYNSMKTSLLCIPEELKRLDAEAVRLKSVRTDKIAVKSSNNSGDALINNLVYREELRAALKQARLWMNATNRALETLLPEERLVLHRCYISRERGAVERLCEELDCEQSSVYRKRDSALLKFTMALYGSLL